jgi:AcrR family transcriptional regulator
MARRSDHTRSELRQLILDAAHLHMAEVGIARFSTREVAKRIGYSGGTVLNVFVSGDGLIASVNTRTFSLWADVLEDALSRDPEDPIRTLVEAYFTFARRNPNLWSAIYAHQPANGFVIDEGELESRSRLTGIVAGVVASALPEHRRGEAERLTRSLVAVVHGHCSLELGGSYALMGSMDARGDALERVRETLQAEATPQETHSGSTPAETIR